MGSMVDHPFGPPVAEIALERVPLVLVVAQARFPTVASIAEGQAFIAPFQERLRGAYPVLRTELQTQLVLGPEGPVQQGTGRVWRFEEHGGPWSVTLAPDFVALSTNSYTSHRDFLDRLASTLTALEEWLKPAVCDRLGVRYVDRLTDTHLLQQLSSLLRPEVLGATSIDTGDDAVERQHSLVDSAFRHTDGSELRARWGTLPENATFDPAVPALPEASWVLDLDMYTTAPEDFSSSTLGRRAQEFAERVYRFFRWAVTDEFLDAHGAAR